MELKNKVMMVVRNAMMIVSRIMMMRWGLYMYLVALFLCYKLPPNPMFKLRKNYINQNEAKSVLLH